MSMTICARKRSFSESIIRNKSSWHTCLKWAPLLTIPFIYHITLFKGRKSTTPSRVRIFTRARVFHSFLHPWRKCRLTGILVKTIYCFRPKGLRKLICFGDAYAYVADKRVSPWVRINSEGQMLSLFPNISFSDTLMSSLKFVTLRMCPSSFKW